MNENINMQISFFKKVSKYILECTPLFEEEVIEMTKTTFDTYMNIYFSWVHS